MSDFYQLLEEISVDSLNKGLYYRSDGSALHINKEVFATTEEINRDMKRNLREVQNYIEDYWGLDRQLKQQFEQFVKYLLKNNVEVIFYVPSYHPILYAYMQETEKYKSVLDAEVYIRHFAKEYDIPTLSSYDPKQAGLSNEDFYDGFHVKAEAIRELFSQISHKFLK